jgi:hypothetical protein
MNHLRRLIALTLSASLAGCAAEPNSSTNGFDVLNSGVAPISSVAIKYGDIEYRDCDSGCTQGFRSFHGHGEPIQNSFTVTWKTADGHDHQAEVPVRSRLAAIEQSRQFSLRFDGDQLSVLQRSKPMYGPSVWKDVPHYR